MTLVQMFYAALARLATSHNGMFRLAAAAYLKPPSHSTVVPSSGAGLRSPGGHSSTVAFAGSHPDADQGLQTIDGGTLNPPGFRVTSSSGSLEGSAGFILLHFCVPFVRIRQC